MNNYCKKLLANLKPIDPPDGQKEIILRKVREERAGRILANIREVVNIPLVGSVSAGSLALAEENIEKQVPVSKKLIKPGNKYFLLRADGDSMNRKGINDGDLVLVKQDLNAKHGDDVVALKGDEAVIKEFDEKKLKLKPRSTNNKHKSIELNEDFILQGIVEAVVPEV